MAHGDLKKSLDLRWGLWNGHCNCFIVQKGYFTLISPLLNILYNIPQYIFYFLGQQHLAFLHLRVGGGGPGVLVGGGLSGLQPAEPCPHGLDRPPVSTVL